MFVFVILHYLAEEMTIECINNITQNFKENNYRIVIVDNASANGSGKRLQDRYKNNPYCTVILNDENLGFAKGNNVGYRHARENMTCDHIIIMNNDVLIEDKDFLTKISDIYKETEFAVLGPDIHSCENGMHQNPMRLEGYSLDELKNFIATRKKWLRCFSLHYLIIHLKGIVKKIIGWKSQVPVLPNDKRIINPVLHGACFIFSKNFIDNEENAFNPDTFMFMEEDILHYTCLKKGYTMVYDPSISVNHLEDVSTNYEYKTGYKKAKMKEKWLYDSASVLFKLMNEVDK